MNWDELRSLCLENAEATETYPFDPDFPVFKSGSGRIFAVANESRGALTITIKCDPELCTELRATYAAVTPGYHFDKRHWITIELNRDLADGRVQELIKDSYSLVQAPAHRRSGTKPM